MELQLYDDGYKPPIRNISTELEKPRCVEVNLFVSRSMQDTSESLSFLPRILTKILHDKGQESMIMMTMIENHNQPIWFSRIEATVKIDVKYYCILLCVPLVFIMPSLQINKTFCCTYSTVYCTR
jgi:hypothetical protein